MLKFLSTVLRRNGVDNIGGPVRSSINCVEENGTKEWDNATWYRKQMMYGQSKVNGELRSWALAKDIVAHELTHGITDYTARIEYLGESGALNESYSDIFGVIVANIGKSDVKKWNWLIGDGLFGPDTALRDMKKPENFDQPSHMDDYQKLTQDRKRRLGWRAYQQRHPQQGCLQYAYGEGCEGKIPVEAAGSGCAVLSGSDAKSLADFAFWR